MKSEFNSDKEIHIERYQTACKAIEQRAQALLETEGKAAEVYVGCAGTPRAN